MVVMVSSISSSRLERFSGLQVGRIFGYRVRGQLGLDKVSLARGSLREPCSAPPETRWSGAPCFASRRLVALRVRYILTHQVAHEAPSTRAHEPDGLPLSKTRQGIEGHLVHPRAEPQ